MLPEAWEACQQVMRSGKIMRFEEQHHDGRWFLSVKSPLRDENQQIIGVIGIAIDITDKKEAERLKIENQQVKLEGMTLVSASIAHEIRTPLTTIDINADTLKENLPLLIETYNRAAMAKLDIPKIDSFTLKGLNELPNIMKRETNGANIFIDMLLTNINPELEGSVRQTFSMQDCVNEALARYPFKANQSQRIRWQPIHDFQVRGKEALVVHILFNLIKNALFYVGKGYIEIILEPGNPYNKLIFTDTGAGIDPDILPHIFNRFFSRTRNGAGVGLAYCKAVMEALGGNITCESVKGNYTKFILSFPVTTM